jgi:hypothetical protein
MHTNNIYFHPVNLINHTFHPSILISPRTFISLSISADFDHPTTSTSTATAGFLTIQIPITVIDSTTSDSTTSSTIPSSSSLPAPLLETISTHALKSTIFAAYTSVERVLLFSHAPPPPQSANVAQAASHIEWTMATTSSAGGMIPNRVQRSWRLGGVPRAVVADVGLFLGWVAREREREREREKKRDSS